MRLIVCDACKANGVMTDITNRNDAWKVKLDGVRMLDICAEHAPLFAEFDEQRKKLLNRHHHDLDEAVAALREAFWKKVKNGAGKESEDTRVQTTPIG